MKNTGISTLILLAFCNISVAQPLDEGLINFKKRKASEKAYNMGIEKVINKDYYAAVTEFDKALEINPKFVEALLQRGKAKFQLNDEYGALTDINKAIELKSNYGEAYFNRGS